MVLLFPLCVLYDILFFFFVSVILVMHYTLYTAADLVLVLLYLSGFTSYFILIWFMNELCTQ